MKKWILPAVALIIFGIILFSLPKATSNNPRVNLTPEPSAQVEAVSTEMVITKNKTYSALLRTTQGDITMQFSADKTPITVNNFVYLARKRFYDNTVFHRIIKGFMIQGGDPEGTGMGGPGYEFEDEVFEGKYTRGTVAMANSGPDTNGSQFFIMHQDYNLPPNYVIFGKVTKGIEVVDKIASAEVKTNTFGEPSTPVTPVKVTSVEIVEE
ncbi:MAG: Peptidyl-prolyl cis-trans isomerase [Candidatus Woesebacteria bacterium GW2011_GWB1_38_5b]|uniref:Peptidyl-prolyl cis-trans isomerase n=1 Tax=Candidatus Woesebacteria bacterium GW2011_GWB1_38_5b TaxID=1618569 RepID=A0A0G0K7P1_9BACT|nr:MAG: Peptidyl-prolyl cis-trans isomerase [Candidatus Woesebacteria bacterium GW2011_GWB1_38_5b]